MKVKAAVCTAFNTPLSIEDVYLDEPKNSEVLVKIMATGVCASDVHTIHGNIDSPLPVVLGHEGAGIVEKVGKDVKTVHVGDRVALSWAPDCGICYFCDSGHSHLCEASAPIVLDGGLLDGTTRISGPQGKIFHYSFLSTWAEYAVVDEKSCIDLKTEIDFVPASLIGCAVMTGVGAAMNTASVVPGSTAVVIGLGGVGLNVIQGARICGAEKIIGIDVNDDKEATARKFGLTHFINSQKIDVLEAVQDLTKGLGTDYAFEVVGNVKLLELAFDITRKRGTIVSIGMAPEGQKVELVSTKVTRGEKKFTGTFYGSTTPRIDFPKIAALYNKGELLLDELVTQILPLDRINDAVKAVEEGSVIRTVIEPHTN